MFINLIAVLILILTPLKNPTPFHEIAIVTIGNHYAMVTGNDTFNNRIACEKDIPSLYDQLVKDGFNVNQLICTTSGIEI